MIAEAFLELLGQAVGDHCPVLYSIALGAVAKDKWIGSPVLPGGRALDAMRRTDWRKVVMQKTSSALLPVVVEAVKRKWK